MPESAAPRRMLVALDVSPSALPALELAMAMAAREGAELTVLLVVDVDVLAAADIPLVRLVGFRSAQPREIDTTTLEREMRSFVEHAREQAMAAAQRASVSHSFRVVRGRELDAIAAAAEDVDLVALAASLRAVREIERLRELARCPIIVLR